MEDMIHREIIKTKNVYLAEEQIDETSDKNKVSYVVLIWKICEVFVQNIIKAHKSHQTVYL